MYLWTFYDHTGGLNLVYQLCTVYISMDIVFFIVAFFYSAYVHAVRLSLHFIIKGYLT